MSRKRPGYTGPPTQGRSSVGRAAVSKTVGRGFESLRPCYSARLERELPEVGEAGDADSDEPQRAGAVAQAAVELLAGEVADRLRRVDPRVERRRAAADGEVGVAELRRYGARHLAAALQRLRDLGGHPAQLVVEPLTVRDVPLERVLDADRDPLRVELELARVDAAGAVAEHRADAAREQAAQIVVGERRELADRLDLGA